MKEKLKTLAIIFSVVLNISFIGSYYYHKSGLNFMADRHVNHNHLLYEELNLSHEQLDRFGPLRDKFHAFVNEQAWKIKAKRLELIDLLAKEPPDHQAINAKRREIQTLQHEMQTKVIAHLLKEGSLFTLEQREKFFALIKERIEKSRDPRPRWMPRKQKNSLKRQRP